MKKAFTYKTEEFIIKRLKLLALIEGVNANELLDTWVNEHYHEKYKEGVFDDE